MTVNSKLLIGSGLLLGAIAAPAVGQSRSSVAARQSEEIRLLKEQVKALTARLDAQEAATRAAAAPATALPTAEAEEVVQSAPATIASPAVAGIAVAATVAAPANATPGQAMVAQSSAPAPAPKWYESTRINGRIYYNFSSISRASDGVKTETGSGFAIKRVYIGIDHKFDDMFAVNITTDIAPVVGPNDGNLVGNGLYVKKGYLEVKFDPAAILRIGAADTPWVPFVENIYGLRHIENTITDRTAFATSADWGFHLLGTLGDGLVSYQASIIDGGGYRQPRFSQSLDVEGRISAHYKGFTAGFGGYYGNLAKDTTGVETFNKATRITALIAYQNKLFTIGGEAFDAKNFKQVTLPTPDEATGFSVFGSVYPVRKWTLFGRYDHIRPSLEGAPAETGDYVNIGVQFSPVQIVDFGLVYKHERVRGGTLTTSNGVIGGVIGGTFDEFGLFGQVRW